MSDFFLLAALLIALAIAFIGWPLLFKARQVSSRDAAVSQNITNKVLHEDAVAELNRQREAGLISEVQFEKLKKDTDAQLEADVSDLVDSTKSVSSKPWVLIAAMALIPIFAIITYQQLGAAADWEIEALIREKSRLQAREPRSEKLNVLAAQLQEKLQDRLESEPDNLNNWMLLGRTSMELGETKQAIASYQKVLEKHPNSPQVISEMAQALFLGAGNQFVPEVKALFDRALMLNPQNMQVLSVAGFSAFQGKDFASAADYWEQIIVQLSPGDQRFKTWQQAIAEAKKQLVASGGTESAPVSDARERTVASDGPKVHLKVSVEEAIKDQIDPNMRVFIYARAMQGPKMPLAMKQVTVKDLPLEVTLNQTMAMMPSMTIAQFSEVELVVRASQGGMAEASPGDWQVTLGPVATDGEETHQLVLSQQID